MDKKKQRKRLLLIIIAVCFLGLCTSYIALADSASKSISDPAEIYKNYKTNTFPLMTSGTKDLGKFEQIVPGISTSLKEFNWALTRMVGTFNANMVQKMFGLDIISPVKHAMMTIASSLAGSLTTIGSTVGICVVALVMLFRYIASSQFKSAIKVFLTTILIFVGLAVIADGKTSESLFNKAFEVDQAINSAIVNVNPVFDHNIDTGGGQATPNGKIQNAGNAMASSIFYANVYEPYLLMNYGTSDQNAIRAKGQVPIGKDKLDRIDGILDHENISAENWGKLVDHEDSKKKNKTIHYKNNWTQMLFSFFYFLVNIIQTAVFFILGLMRLAMALIEVLLIPVLPILLILALFQVLQGVWGNYAKAFGIAIVSKGLIGFAIIMFASYISLGFNIASKNGDIFDKLITIGVYVLAPIFVYFYRKIFVEILKGQFSFSDIPHLVTHPKEVAQGIAKKHAEKKQALQAQRKVAKEEAKKAKRAEFEQRQKDGSMNEFRQSKPNQTHSEKRKDFSPRKEAKKQEEQQTSGASARDSELQGRAKDTKNTDKLDEKKRQQELQEQQAKNASKNTKKESNETEQHAKEDGGKRPTEEKRTEEAKQIGTRRPRNHKDSEETSSPKGTKETQTKTATAEKQTNDQTTVPAKQPQQKASHNTSMQHRSDKRNDMKPKPPTARERRTGTEKGTQSQAKSPSNLQQTKQKVSSPTRRQKEPAQTSPATQSAKQVQPARPMQQTVRPTVRTSQPTLMASDQQIKRSTSVPISRLIYEKRQKPRVEKTTRTPRMKKQVPMKRTLQSK